METFRCKGYIEAVESKKAKRWMQEQGEDIGIECLLDGQLLTDPITCQWIANGCADPYSGKIQS